MPNFVRDFAKKYGYTQGDVREFMRNLSDYLEEEIRYAREVDISGVLHMYYSYYPSRKAPPVVKGVSVDYEESEYVDLKPIIRVRYRVPYKFKQLQRLNSHVIAEDYEKQIKALEENEYDNN